MNFEEMKNVIPSYIAGYFTTVDGNKPDVRGWQLQCIEDNKIYFCTSNQKNVYKQLQANPECGFICTVGTQTFRIEGKCVFVTDRNEIEKIHAKTTEQVKSLYPTIDDNGFAAFYIEHGTVKYADGFKPFEKFEF